MGNCCNCLKGLFSDKEGKDDKLLMPDLDVSLVSRDSTSSTSSERNSTVYVPDVAAKLTDFKKLKVLGKGSFGKVVLVQLVSNNKLFAMKILKKKVIIKRRQVNHTKTERVLLEKLNHPFIVKLYYAFQDEQKLYFITEFMQGGELFFHLKRNSIYKDRAVVFYLSEIILAIEYMHNNNFIYRDLKPENILIDKHGHIKLTDFGLSKIVSDEEKKTYTMCGTAEYLAPEVIFEKGYDKTCDWFSLGVVMYEMLCGIHPFPRKSPKMELKTYTKPLQYPKNVTVSSQAKDLISKLLEPNPRKRLGYNGADDIKRHKYFKEIDFEMVVEKKYKPPFVPKLYNDFDLRYFDIGFTSDNVESLENNTKIKSLGEFEGFSYQPNGVS